MLTCSGLGSLWSGRLGLGGAGWVAAAIVALIGAQAWLVPWVFAAAAALPLSGRVVVAATVLAPLALVAGVPFPYAMRAAQARAGRAVAALLFALNAAAGAIAVPLAMNLGTGWGLTAVLAVAAIAYAIVGVLIGARDGGRLRVAANVSAIAGTALLVLSPLVAVPMARTSGNARADDGAPSWRVYAARYGHSMIGADRVFADGSADEARPFGWFFWIVRGGGRTILVDTGFDDERQARDWDVTGYVRPSARLAALGIRPEDVTDVILTHAHWDHMGGIAAYPRARIHMQEAEYRHAIGSVGAERPRRHGIRWRDVRALRAAEAEGRVVRVAGDGEPFPGVRLVAGGGHTPGSQWVEVDTVDGTVVIAGDAVTQDENNAWHRAIAQGAEAAENLAALRRMQARAASLLLILPGHDPGIETWFPRVAPGIVEVTARAPDSGGWWRTLPPRDE
jgi:glyoxylase-like metal-dependent hydrolase (beta-lactamase superfamily II)